MEEEEKRELLKRIEMMRMEAKAKLNLISFLSNNGENLNENINVILDKLKRLDELEKEIKNKK